MTERATTPTVPVPAEPFPWRPFLIPYACLIAVGTLTGAAVGFWLWPESGQE